MKKPIYGASPDAWRHFQAIGLTADLLPVVSDPTVPKHDKSDIAEGGFSKVPSQITRDGFAVGLPGWTKSVTADKQVDRWAEDSRHGISLKTGTDGPEGTFIIALDNDVDDRPLSAEVREFITLKVGILPHRYRNDSGKFTQLVRVRGTFRKRSVKVRDGLGAIEMLAKGQQTVICGTHTKGERYQWEGGLPTHIPEITVEQLEDLWAGLVKEFGDGTDLRERGGMIRHTAPAGPNASSDEVSNYLEANDWIKSWAPDGSLNITCPFDDHHTQPSSESSTQYKPPGVGRKEDGTPFEQGHFKCLHSHCTGRIDADYLDAIGYMQGEFEDMTGKEFVALDGTTVKVAEVPAVPPPRYERTRDGSAVATTNNLTMALERPDQCGMRIAWDNFRDEIVWATPGTALDWRAFRDHDYMTLRNELQRRRVDGGIGFKSIGRELIRDCVHFVAMNNQMDSATTWAASLVWDGVPRVREFFSTYFRAVNSPYTRAVSMYTWTALAGRALVPGIKADMAIILKSEQGTVKTEGIKSMAPHADAFGEIDLGKGDDVLARQTRGKLVCEISELRGLNSREHGAIKSWVSRTHEEWVPKFKEFATKFPRRFICLGSTNEEEFLADATGERRWLPMEVGRTDIDALKRDCEQLWAEGVHIFKHGYAGGAAGVQWADAERLARAEHSRFKVLDSWEDVIGAWLDEEEFGQAPGIRQGDRVLKLHHVLQSAVGVNVQNITRRDELRVAKVLRKFGYEKDDFRAGKEVYKGWANKARMEAARRMRKAVEDIA